MPALGPTERFSTRVENYVRYRPGYPAAIIELLKEECGLDEQSLVADIGSGTGKLAELFLSNGNRVSAVEPNREMRQAAEGLLAGFPNFTSVDATAESTSLARHSVDFITAGQAFHWFDQERIRPEFARILRSDGWVVLIWNARSTASPFQQDYEQLLLNISAEYAQVTHRNIEDDGIRLALGLEPFRIARFANHQDLDLEGLIGRVLSSSYAPEPGHPEHPGLIAGLQRLFERYQSNGLVRFAYDTQVYYGQMSR